MHALSPVQQASLSGSSLPSTLTQNARGERRAFERQGQSGRRTSRLVTSWRPSTRDETVHSAERDLENDDRAPRSSEMLPILSRCSVLLQPHTPSPKPRRRMSEHRCRVEKKQTSIGASERFSHRPDRGYNVIRTYPISRPATT